jgi:hypothetical protein
VVSPPAHEDSSVLTEGCSNMSKLLPRKSELDSLMAEITLDHDKIKNLLKSRMQSERPVLEWLRQGQVDQAVFALRQSSDLAAIRDCLECILHSKVTAVSAELEEVARRLI